MKENVNRPRRISSDQVDGAVDEALNRVGKMNELLQEELDQVSGGTVVETTAGFFPTEPEATLR
jgi:hypothetical protein